MRSRRKVISARCNMKVVLVDFLGFATNMQEMSLSNVKMG